MAAQDSSDKRPSDISLSLVAEVVAAYVSKNKVLPAELPELLRTVHDTFAAVSARL